MRKFLIAAVALGVVAVIVLYALAAPAKTTAHNLAAINGLTVGQTTEAELLTRKEFQTIPRICHEADCFYHMETENTFLHALHLAPAMRISTGVKVRDGMVTGVSVLALREGLTALSITQVAVMPPDCSSNPCIKRFVLPTKAVVGITVLLRNDSAVRNHLQEAVNSNCLSRLRGCGTYAELMPITKDLNLEATRASGDSGK